jgi:hypothetical protein
MTKKFRPRNTEVEAIQLTRTSIGTILEKVEQILKQNSFEIYWPTEGRFSIRFSDFNVKGGHDIVIYEGDYVVFDINDFDVLTEQRFKEMFEPVPEPNTGLGVIKASQRLYNPLTLPIDQLSWNQVIVTD